MGSINWQVVGIDEKGEFVWEQRSVKFWDLLLYGEGTRSDLFEEWNSLILEQKHGIDFETEEVTRKLENSKGYTLIELMIVVCILGILSAVAIPRAGDAVAKAKAGATLGNLATMRAAITMYSVNNDGEFPKFPPEIVSAGYGDVLKNALVPIYLKEIPMAMQATAWHKDSNKVGEFFNQIGQADDEANGYGTGWRYDANHHDENWGSIRLLCTHRNAKGVSWTTF